jgi:Leucine-rich repeat (LRR) protein
LASNEITRIDNLDLRQLVELDLSHNQIKRLENMDRLISLQKLSMSKNLLPDIDYLMVLSLNKLKDVDFSYNRLPVSYLDQLLQILAEMTFLRSVSFAGNELALNKFYRIKISSLRQLTSLDGMTIKEYSRHELKVGGPIDTRA